MIRKGEKKAIRAFLAGQPHKLKNDEIRRDGEIVTWLYHGHVIAKCYQGCVKATMAGWNTVSTRSRLNALCRELGTGHGFYCRRFEPYFDGQEIDDTDWLTVKERP